MQFKPLTRVALATALIFAFSACSDSSGDGLAFDGTATTEDTEIAGGDAADFATEIADAMNFGSPQVFLAAQAFAARAAAKHPAIAQGPLATRLHRGVLTVPGLVAVAGAPMQFSAANGCTVESYGTDGDPFDPYYGNENLIPDDWGVKYTCIERDTTDIENVVTHRMHIEITVKENMASMFGYTAKMVYEETIADEQGHEMGGRLDGSDFVDVRSTGVDRRESYREREWSTSGGETEEGVYGEENNAAFDPDGSITGQPLPDGALDFTGKQYYYSTGGTSLSFTIDTPTPLHYSAACLEAGTEPPFDSGVIRGRLNGNSSSASFTVTFADCDDYSVTTENTEDVPAVAVRR